mgnify:CR=1 FL=1
MKEETMDATVYVGFDVAFSDMFKGGKNYTRKQFINKGSEIYCRVQMPDENSMNTADFNALIKLIKDQTKSNNDKIKALSNIQNGLELLIGLVGKLI